MCRFCLAALGVDVGGGILSVMARIVKRYNGDDVLPAVFKSLRSQTFFLSGSFFRSYPGFLTLRAADGGYAPAKKLVQERDLVPFRELTLPTRR